MNTELPHMIGVLTVVLLPALALWFMERRKRKLSEHRLGISRAVTQMEMLMRDGSFTMGDVCHDRILAVMQIVQAQEHFSVSFPMGKLSPEAKMLAHRVERETSRGDMAARHHIVAFTYHYIGAFVASRPLTSWLHLLAILIRVGFAKLASHGLQVFAGWRQFKQVAVASTAGIMMAQTAERTIAHSATHSNIEAHACVQ